jgi:peroxiredoxin
MRTATTATVVRLAPNTFVLANGEGVAVYESVDPDGHAREVLGTARNVEGHGE